MCSRLIAFIAASFLVALVPAAAFAANCTPPCANVQAGVKPTSILPNPDGNSSFKLSPNSQITTLNVAGNGSQAVLFNFTIGSTLFDTLYVNENGLVSFGAPIASLPNPAGVMGFQQVDSLSEFKVPAIAPFYADLASNTQTNADAKNPYLGKVLVEEGTADPYPNGGSYQAEDYTNALRITWYGLTAGNNDQVFAQLLLTEDLGTGTGSFQFNYGLPNGPPQNADGSIAGFALGPDAYQFSPQQYVGEIPTYFELDNGRFVGSLAASAIPEPATWIQLLVGFAVLAAGARRATFVIRSQRDHPALASGTQKKAP